MGKESRKKGRKRARRGLVVSDILMALTACLLIYPIVSDVYNDSHTSKMLADYRQTVAAMDSVDLDQARADALAYNAELAGRGNARFTMTEAERARYESLMHVGTTDEMAFVTCEKIGVAALPVYHGTTSEVLQVGVGHYEGSSLPVGGESAHCVLSGHSGMAGLKMFSELSRLENGDVFQVEALGETLYYQVDEINQVRPSDLTHLGIDQGEDFCTLVTCIPIGLNSERLLVRGHRVDAPQAGSSETGGGEGSAENPLLALWEWLNHRFAPYELAMAAGAGAIVCIFLVPDGVRAARRLGKRKRDEESDDSDGAGREKEQEE